MNSIRCKKLIFIDLHHEIQINKMKDSVWIYIKDSLLAPVIFVIEFSVMPFTKQKKRKYKNKSFFEI